MMKRTFILLGLILTFASSLIAAGPKWMKQASKSMVVLYALQQRGDTLVSKAFFTDENGTVVAPFKVIQNARSAWITDASGKRFEVVRIQGFNSTYNVARLAIDLGKKKSSSLPLAGSPLTKGERVYLMPQATADEVAQVEKADEYNYYTLRSNASPSEAGTPVINEQGEVVAILQSPVVAAKSPNYGLDIRFAQSLAIRAIDANNSDLRQCSIPKQLPSDEGQATSFLYLAQNADVQSRLTYADDFIQLFPKSVTGYVQKAEALAFNQQYNDAFQVYEAGIKQETGHNDELLYSRSRVIYAIALQKADGLPDNWTLEQALQDVTAAQETNPLPLYSLHEANIRFALKQYPEAYKLFMAATQTKMRSAELFLYAWQCQQQMGADKDVLLALNDSAVACFSKPYPTSAAPFLLLRSQTLQDMGRLREAITDLNDYEHLMSNQLTAKFYYQREQLEVQTRMYAAAVNDIQRAITLEPNEPLFHAESAALLFRLKDLDGAVAACRKAIALDADFPDAHRLLGVCLREKGDMAGARRELQKSIELGDKLAQDILDKIRD